MYRIHSIQVSVSEMKKPRNGYLGLGNYGLRVLYIEDADYVMGDICFGVRVIEPVKGRVFVQF